MPSNNSTKQRIRAIYGTGLVSWILLTLSLFSLEWTRQGDKHCGIIFCCYQLYRNCSITETSIAGKEFSYVFSSWMFCFVAIYSSTCRCTNVKTENVRQMAVLLLLSGVLSLTGSADFFIRKFANDDLNFAAGGLVVQATAWMMFIAGCWGCCHGYGYTWKKIDFVENSVFPVNIGPRSFGEADRADDSIDLVREDGKQTRSRAEKIPTVSAAVSR